MLQPTLAPGPALSKMAFCPPSDETITLAVDNANSPGLPRRPSPVVSTDSSRATSYRETTACNSPGAWSFEEKFKNVDNIQQVR